MYIGTIGHCQRFSDFKHQIRQKADFLWHKCAILQLMFSKTLRNYLPIILIILLASVLRLWQLGNVPISMSDDEIREVYTAYSIAHSGKDIFGNFMPIVFKMDGFNTWGTVPIYLRVPFSFIFSLTPFFARLPYALSSIFSVFLFYLIIRKLFNDKIALFSSFVASVSVWQIQLSRIAIETDITIFLYLLGIFVYLYSKKNIKLVYLSMAILFLAFYGYSAFKIFFLPLVFILAWYKYKEFGKKIILIVLVTLFLALGTFGGLSVIQGASQYSSAGGSPFFFLEKQQTSLAIELERRASVEPSLIKTIYHNKFTYWGRTAAINYLTSFSPQYLFLNQESSGIYSIWGRGEMYIFELPLLIIGIGYLFKKKRKEFNLILLLLLISPLPSALGVGGATWTSRSAFMALWLFVFVGAGIYFLFNYPKKQVYKYAVLGILAIFYLYSISGYLSQYYFDWSRTNAKYFSKSTKDLVFLIKKYQSENKNVLVAGATENTFMHYAFYNQLDPKLVQDNINKSPIRFSNFTFQKDCAFQIPTGIVYISQSTCSYKATPSAEIKAYNNQEVVWNIYGN